MKNKNIKIFIYTFTLLILAATHFSYAQRYNINKKKNVDRYLKLLYPLGTESFWDNSEIEIKWNSSNVEKIRIEILDKFGNVKYTVPNITADRGKYLFKNIFKFPKQFKIKISDTENSSVYNISPFYLEKNNSNKVLLKQKKALTSSSLAPLKIMPLGNSITEGYTIPLPEDRNGYRKLLKQKLDSAGLTFDFVGSLTNGSFADNQHEGHGGWHAKHWHQNYNYDLNSHLRSFLEMNPPDIVLLHIGTNDIGEYWDSRNDNTIDTTVADVSDLLDTIYTFDPTIKVILAKIINREDNTDTPTVDENAETSAFNIALEVMVNSRIANGDNLALVDMESALTYPDDLSDGVHPDSSGYNKMSQVWFDAIQSVLPKLSVKVFLEGSYLSNQLMSTELQTVGSIPTNQPFNRMPWNYNGTESVANIPNDITDWILVSLRADVNPNTGIGCRAGFLRNDGIIVDLDGESLLKFPIDEGNYYIVIEHRNHLSIMSSAKVSIIP